MFSHAPGDLYGVKAYCLTDDDLVLARAALAKALGTDAPLQQGPFPTPLPVTLTAAKLSEVSRQPALYLLCEKTDGMRFLLFLTRLKGVKILLLVNRRFDMYVLDLKAHFNKSEAQLFDNQGTILDGELVRPNASTDRLRFYIFDAILMSGTHLGALSLPDRLARVVTVLYAKLASPAPAPATSACAFELHVKKYFKADTGLDEFLDHYATVQGQVPVDGVIITPVTLPVAPGRNFHLLKWKAAADQTVDFVYTGSGALCVFDSGQLKPVASIVGAEADRSALDSLWLAAQPGGGSAPRAHHLVIECVYDSALMGWRFVRQRTDKGQGNNMRTYLATLESIRSPLQFTDITAALRGGGIGPRRPARQQTQETQSNRAPTSSRRPPVSRLNRDNN